MNVWIIAAIRTWVHWPTIGHAATVVAAVAAVVGVTFTSCHNRRQLQLTERENRTNWQCEFLYHKEDSLADLLADHDLVMDELAMRSEPISELVSRTLPNGSSVMAATIIGALSRRGGIDKAGLLTRLAKPEEMASKLEVLKANVSSNAYLFPDYTDIETLNSGLSVDDATAFDLEKIKVVVGDLRTKIRYWLGCARIDLRNTCDPRSEETRSGC